MARVEPPPVSLERTFSFLRLVPVVA
jgi:hypothetical protein